VVGHRTIEERSESTRHSLMVGCRKKIIETEEDAEKFRFHLGICQEAKLGFCLEKIMEFPVTEKCLLPVG
jgi:hypothetical protein